MAICYHPKLITKPKTSHIQIIPAFPEALGITVEGANLVANHGRGWYGQLLERYLFPRKLCYHAAHKTMAKKR
jgi:hypothetical protein